jgi:polyhydroxybutyrate depolymerase
MKKLLLSFLIFTATVSVAQTTVIDSILSGGIYRNYRVYVPAAYNGTTAWPLVFDLHGYTSSAQNEQLYSNFMPIADTAHFIIVYPNGTLLSGQPFWNAGFGATVNDVQFISNLIDSISAQYNIDANSVYSCGMSNGGYMSHTLACELNDKIAAIASVTGSMSVLQKSTCVPNRAVPVMQISGNADGTVAYTGSTTSLHIDTLVKYWSLNNNCNLTPVFTAVPNTNLTDGCTAEHYVYGGGDMGSSVELYKIIGGGHTWPGSPFTIGVTNRDFNASLMIWLFFRKYHLTQFTGMNELTSTTDFSIYPNPSSDRITINSKETGLIQLLDVNGKMILETRSKEIDVASFSKGIYFVVITTDKSRGVKKFVKI